MSRAPRTTRAELARVERAMDTHTDDMHHIPMVLTDAPSWSKVIAYSDRENSITSWRTWFSVIMLPLRALCVALLMITSSMTMLTITSASLVSIILIWITS